MTKFPLGIFALAAAGITAGFLHQFDRPVDLEHVVLGRRKKSVASPPNPKAERRKMMKVRAMKARKAKMRAPQ